MDQVRSIALSSDVMTFTGSLNFLDSQDSFDIIFLQGPVHAESYFPQEGTMRY